jgi:hypothetical protein
MWASIGGQVGERRGCRLRASLAIGPSSARVQATARAWTPFPEPIIAQVRIVAPPPDCSPHTGDGAVCYIYCEVCGPIDDVRSTADTRVARSLTAEERESYFGDLF